MALGKYAVDYEMRVDYNRLRRERLQRAKDQINKDGLGSLITWDEANIRYLTSYYVTTPLRANELQFVFISRNDEPILFGGGTPSETERRMQWMKGRIKATLGIPKLTAKDSNDPALAGIVDAVGKLMAEHGWKRNPWVLMARHFKCFMPRPSAEKKSRRSMANRPWMKQGQ